MVAVLQELEDDAVHQRLERGVDDVVGNAHRPPARARAIGRFDQNAGDRLGPAIEDTDLVVRKLQVFDFGLVLAEILAQR
ncbi:hypothetical protein D3C72_2016840 [compost metagenome]